MEEQKKEDNQKILRHSDNHYLFLGVYMINLIKTLFKPETKLNKIAQSIEIVEIPAETWWG